MNRSGSGWGFSMWPDEKLRARNLFYRQSHRTVVYKVDVHHRSKLSGCDGTTEVTCEHRHESIVHRLGMFRRCRVNERRSVASFDTAIEGELRDDKSIPAHVDDRPVHLSLVVREDPQVGTFACHPFQFCVGVKSVDAEKDEHPAVDRAHSLPVDSNSGAFYSLNKCYHGTMGCCSSLRRTVCNARPR